MTNEEFMNATISNYLIFPHVMCDEAICKLFLEKLLNMKIQKLEIIEDEKQIDGKPKGKASRLDVYVVDDKDNRYDIEMQTTNSKDDDIAKRSRYYQAQLDLDSLPKGKSYIHMQKSYVIFVCTFDPFGKNRRVYTFRNRCDENNDITLNDGAMRIFLNAKGTIGEVDKDIIGFLNYVRTNKPEGELARRVDDKVKDVKSNDETRVRIMTLAQEMIRKEEIGWEKGHSVGHAEGREEGLEDKTVDVIKNLLEAKKDINLISLALKMKPSQVRKLAKKYQIVL